MIYSEMSHVSTPWRRMTFQTLYMILVFTSVVFSLLAFGFKGGSDSRTGQPLVSAANALLKI